MKKPAKKGFVPFEKSTKDKKMDKKKGAPKEGSKSDMKKDFMAMRRGKR